MMIGTIQLRTQHLELREENLDDAKILHKELGCNPAIVKFTDWNPYITLESTKEKIKIIRAWADEANFTSRKVLQHARLFCKKIEGRKCIYETC